MLFINATQHTLTQEQIEERKNFDIKNLSDLTPELFNKLKNSPDNTEDCRELAEELYFFLDSFINGAVVLLPIGSPLFMAKYIELVTEQRLQSYPHQCKYEFAHSERASVENNDGTKTVKFIHRKFNQF